MPVARVVSLLPAATEMVFVLGAGDRLVGRSHECDFPADVTRLPAVTSARVDSTRASGDIHRAVGDAISAGQSLYSIDGEQLRKLRPDLVLTQDQCAVCAVSRPDLDDVLRHLGPPGPEVLSFSPQRFADLWSDLRRLGLALGLPDGGRSAIAPLKSRVVDVIQNVASAVRKPTVACLEWLSPLMGSGNWIPEMVQMAGGIPVLGAAGKHSEWVSFDALAKADPDVILALPCGFTLERTQREVATLLTDPRWNTLRAVREGRVLAVDGSAYFNRPGPRLVDSLAILAEILHPDLHPGPDREGGDWTRVVATANPSSK